MVPMFLEQPKYKTLKKEETRINQLSNIVIMDYIRSMCSILSEEIKKYIKKEKKTKYESILGSNEDIPLTYEEQIIESEKQIRKQYGV